MTHQRKPTMLDDNPDPPTVAGDAIESPEEALQQSFGDVELEKRLWLRSMGAILLNRIAESDKSGRVQYALDMLAIAAAERAVRICGSDLAGDRSDITPRG